MEKIFKFVGVILLVMVAIYGVLYLLDIAGVPQADAILGQFAGGIQGSMTGISNSVSGMFNR